MSPTVFEEKILYKTHQHWIVLVYGTLKLIGLIVVPLTILTYFLSGYSLWTTAIIGLLTLIGVVVYDHYLWHHSWLLIGNQKVTLTVRNGLWSHYAMSMRYRNIRDAAVSKNNILGFLLKYGTLFLRSSTREGDFQAHHVPKVGKVYALVNALSRYSDEERSQIDTIEKLHQYHQKIEYSREDDIAHTSGLSPADGLSTLLTIPGISQAVELGSVSRSYIQSHEETRNHGVLETMRRQHVVIFLHDHTFRPASGELTRTDSQGNVYFPSLPFPEIRGKNVTSGSPSEAVHQYLLGFFPYANPGDATVVVGWDE